MDITAPTKEEQKPVEIFCCYAREDQPLLRELEKQLMPLKREGIISFWSDTDINAGTDWEKEIHLHLNTSHIILLLVSPDFMASEYCYSIEMLRAMERHRNGETQVIPIILRPVDWQSSPFGKLQVLPKNAVPVVNSVWHTQDEAFLTIAEGIRGAVKARFAEEKSPPKMKLVELTSKGLSRKSHKIAERKQVRQVEEVGQHLAQKQAHSKIIHTAMHPLRTFSDQFKRQHFPIAIALMLLLALLFGGNFGISYILSGNWPENLFSRQTSFQMNATTTALAHARTPGIMWSAQYSGTTEGLGPVIWADSQFVAVGDHGVLLTSLDGRSWTPRNTHVSGINSFLAGIAWSGAQFVAVGSIGAEFLNSASVILTSPDGSVWTTQHPLPSTTWGNGLGSVTWSGSQFVAVGGLRILTSPDGRIWTPQYSGAQLSLETVAWLDTQFIIVGVNTVLTSPDGRFWTPQYTGLSGIRLFDVAWSGKQFVSVGTKGTILDSPDGHAWAPQKSSTSKDLSGVVWAGRQFVVVGDGGTILTSPDGHIWTPQNSHTSQSLSSVTWSGHQLVVVGSNGVVLTSP